MSKWLDWFIGEMVQYRMSRAWLVLGTGYFWYFVSVQFHFFHSESLRDNRRSHDYLPMPKYSYSNSYQLLINLFLYLLHSENTLKKSQSSAEKNQSGPRLAKKIWKKISKFSGCSIRSSNGTCENFSNCGENFLKWI